MPSEPVRHACTPHDISQVCGIARLSSQLQMNRASSDSPGSPPTLCCGLGTRTTEHTRSAKDCSAAFSVVLRGVAAFFSVVFCSGGAVLLRL